MACRLYVVCLVLTFVTGCERTPSDRFVDASISAPGNGEKEKPESEFETTLRIAEQGDADAQFNLGAMYTFGRGVPQDYAEALKWFRKAAEQGEARAQSNLGWMYRTGKGVPKDDTEAYAWWSIAAANNDEVAKEWLPKAKAALTPEQLAEGQKLATELFEQINANKAK